jgi:hypothetical protein
MARCSVNSDEFVEYDPRAGLSDDDPDSSFWAKNASDESAATVLAADPESDEGRSPWFWLRTPNGDLLFCCFPQGDTYFETELDHSG